jgi:hypothetical protein
MDEPKRPDPRRVMEAGAVHGEEGGGWRWREVKECALAAGEHVNPHELHLPHQDNPLVRIVV